MFIAGLFVLAAERARGDRRADRRSRRRRSAARRVGRAHGGRGPARTAGTESGSGARTTTPALPSGPPTNEEGRIFVEPQGMCVMAGIGLDDGLAARALASVREHLATPHGSCSSSPPYTRYRLELGEITSYPPGYKENAGVFCHTNPWIDDRRGARRPRRRGARLLPAHQPVGARGDQRHPPLRAVRLRADDRRAATRRRTARRRTRGSPGRRRGTSSRSRSGSWASGPSTTACASIRACRPTGTASSPSAPSAARPTGSPCASRSASGAASARSSWTVSEVDGNLVPPGGRGRDVEVLSDRAVEACPRRTEWRSRPTPRTEVRGALGPKAAMRLAGIEPATSRSGGARSIP